MKNKMFTTLLGAIALSLGCSDAPEAVLHIEVPTQNDRRESTLSVPEPEVLAEDAEVPWALPDAGEFIAEETFPVSEFARVLSLEHDGSGSFDELFDLARRSAPLNLHVELPMYGKELPILTASFESFEHFIRCLHGQVELGLCGASEELEVLLYDHKGIVEEELRSCIDGCCHFSYRYPVEEQLTLRQVCFEELNDGRLNITDLTLAAP